MSDVGRIVADQVAYYRARAPEYDEYYERTGPFDVGPEGNAEWRAELQVAQSAVLDAVTGDVLELAAGTGWWTEQLAERASTVVAVDAAAEMLDVNRGRNASRTNVEIIEADVFAIDIDRPFDIIFFAFWMSHVPLGLFDEFWKRVGSWLAPGGHVAFVDNLDSSAPTIQWRPGHDHSQDEIMVRRLNDGTEHTIVKRVWTPESLRDRLAPEGWAVHAAATPRYFLYGHATR